MDDQELKALKQRLALIDQQVKLIEMLQKMLARAVQSDMAMLAAALKDAIAGLMMLNGEAGDRK